ncbi:MAG: type II toxin-antitoxin system VapC family toxin [Burkholderiaceae bacterium]|nr:type II toxin-antitoxin system VapC family toxin [Burkholderiaceae bacterium]
MRYLDTSLLVAALTSEAMTRVAQRWLASQPAGSIAISDWVITEFSAALSIKLREKQIGAADRAEVLTAFARLAEESLEVWPVTRADYRTAARFADLHASGLRAGDALHLAVSAERGAPICTLDRAMITAARSLGVGAAPPA